MAANAGTIQRLSDLRLRPTYINLRCRCFAKKDKLMAEDEELTDADWRTLCETLRGSISMFTMLLAECGDNSETARVIEAARRRRQKVLDKIERRL